MAITNLPVPSSGGKEKRIASFTASGSWTVPTGVTYAIAHVRGGGGGFQIGSAGTAGGNSTVDFSTTVTATGGSGIQGLAGSDLESAAAGPNNSGLGGRMSVQRSWATSPQAGYAGSAQDGAYIVNGQNVTPGSSVSVTVGAGGSSTAAGGSGYVYIEYYE